MAFPRDVLLVVIAVGIPRERQRIGILSQYGRSGQTDLRRGVRIWFWAD
jgi:hypothetical protein